MVQDPVDRRPRGDRTHRMRHVAQWRIRRVRVGCPDAARAPPHAGARRADRDAARAGRDSPRRDPCADRRLARAIRGEAAPRGPRAAAPADDGTRGRPICGRRRTAARCRAYPATSAPTPCTGVIRVATWVFIFAAVDGGRRHGPVGRAAGRDPAASSAVAAITLRRHPADPWPDPRDAPADDRGRHRARPGRAADRAHRRRHEPVRVHAGADRRRRRDRRDAGGDAPPDRRRGRHLPRRDGRSTPRRRPGRRRRSPSRPRAST